MIYMATFCSKRESREKNNCRLSEEFQETRPMKLPGNFGLDGAVGPELDTRQEMPEESADFSPVLSFDFPVK